jgi:hypothetical protein
MKRRDFLKTAAGGVLAASLGLPRVNLLADDLFHAKPTYRWYKGNFHCHSQWSDGVDLPEVVVSEYKRHGYDFLSLTDHNILHKDDLRFTGFSMNYTPSDLKPFEGETSFWKRTAPAAGWPNLVQSHIDKAKEMFGEDSVRIKETADGVYVRMKTEEELRQQFAEPGKFLLMPGFEMTSQWMHVNLINVEEDFFIEGPSIEGVLHDAFDKATELYGANEEPYLFMVNHPLWQYYNIQPSYLFGRPGVRFIELTNNSTQWQYYPEAWDPEQLWDIVNAYRAKNEQPSFFATGTDDSHGVFREDYLAYFGWTRVRAESLDSKSIINGLLQGCSYVSSGCEFADLTFDGKTLAVKLDPQVEGDYRIEFIGTKKDYDETVKYIDVPGEGGRPARKLECWSKEIGKVLETVDGLEASYTLKQDDLYVRAKAYRIGAGSLYQGSGSKQPTLLAADCAWSQPYRQGEKL